LEGLTLWRLAGRHGKFCVPVAARTLLHPVDMDRILVAVDDSVRAPHVLATAANLARLTKAKLRVYRAVAVPPDFTPAGAAEGDRLPKHLNRIAIDRIQELLEPFADVFSEVVVGQSHSPARAILHAADAFDADLIVIGSHGYDLVDRLLGTTAATVVNSATRDVLVVHRRA
jgi:nucleotide-binding universal stress UspA family protein